MSVKSSIKVLLVGLANRPSYQERKDRLLNNLHNIFNKDYKILDYITIK